MSTDRLIRLVFCDMNNVSLSDSKLTADLSAEENARADRFRFPELRRQYCVSRALLRRILGQVCDSAPAKVVIRTTELGKPFVDEGPAFNLAHSESFLLIAVADSGRLGVDIECPKPVRDLDDLVRRYFSEAEVEEFETLADDARHRAFFRGWARKEAFIKALGGGMTIGLDSFSVRLARTTDNALRAVRGLERDPGRWDVRSLDVEAPAEAAVAWDRTPFATEMSSVSPLLEPASGRLA